MIIQFEADLVEKMTGWARWEGVEPYHPCIHHCGCAWRNARTSIPVRADGTAVSDIYSLLSSKNTTVDITTYIRGSGLESSCILAIVVATEGEKEESCHLYDKKCCQRVIHLITQRSPVQPKAQRTGTFATFLPAGSAIGASASVKHSSFPQ